MSERADVASIFSFVYTLPVYVRVCLSVCMSCFFEMFDVLGGHFGVFDSQHHFPSYFSLIFVPLCTGPGTHCHPWSLFLSRSRSRDR